MLPVAKRIVRHGFSREPTPALSLPLGERYHVLAAGPAAAQMNPVADRGIITSSINRRRIEFRSREI